MALELESLLKTSQAAGPKGAGSRSASGSVARIRSAPICRQRFGGPVDLHRVVRRRIVAGRNNDTAVAVLIVYGEGQRGRAAIAVEKINGKPGRGHDPVAQFGEVSGLMASVVGHRVEKATGPD